MPAVGPVTRGTIRGFLQVVFSSSDGRPSSVLPLGRWPSRLDTYAEFPRGAVRFRPCVSPLLRSSPRLVPVLPDARRVWVRLCFRQFRDLITPPHCCIASS